MATLVDLDDNLTADTPKVNGGTQDILTTKAEEQMRQLDILDTPIVDVDTTTPATNEHETQNHLDTLEQVGVVEESNLIDDDLGSGPIAAKILEPVKAPPTPQPVKPATPQPAKTPTPKPSNLNTAPEKATAKSAKATESPVTKPPTPSRTPKGQPSSQPRTVKQTNGTSPVTTKPPGQSAAAKKVLSPSSPAKGVSPSQGPGSARTVASARRASAPPPNAGSPAGADGPNPEVVKKLPMNKIKVGSTPSPNIKEVKSKIGSLPGALPAPPKTAGSKVQIPTHKLNWKAESKIGSMSNLKHTPGGGNVKIDSQKIELKATSKIGSLQNVKHKPGGGEKKIFDDKEYLKKSNPSSKTPSEQGENSTPQSPTPRGEGTLVGVNIGDV